MLGVEPDGGGRGGGASSVAGEASRRWICCAGGFLAAFDLFPGLFGCCCWLAGCWCCSGRFGGCSGRRLCCCVSGANLRALMENYSREASGFKKLEKKSICLLESFSSWLSLVIWVEKIVPFRFWDDLPFLAAENFDAGQYDFFGKEPLEGFELGGLEDAGGDGNGGGFGGPEEGLYRLSSVGEEVRIREPSCPHSVHVLL